MRPRFAPLASMSVLVQVALLAVFAVVASQAVVFAVVLTAPPPRPAGFGIPAAADALSGRPAETSDGRALVRRISNQPPQHEVGGGPVERAISAGLAQRLGRGPDDVRVWLSPERAHWRPGLPRGPRPPDQGALASSARITESSSSIVFTRRAEPGEDPQANHDAIMAEVGEVLARRGIPPPTGSNDVRVVAAGGGPQRFTVTADRLTFAPFSASVRLDDGRWATVEPPHGLIDPWQMRLLIALGITALLLAPLVWFMARRLTRPIRQFAEAAERLGADPDAEPLTPSGPSEVRTAIGAFNDMQASIRGHMRQRTQTIAAIAHDLRTPLTRLRFRAEQAPDALRDKMAGDVEEMDALIGQAMAYVRGETTPERRERLDLTELAEACANSFSDTGEPVVFEGGRPMAITADPVALRRALANLIGNAVKYAGSARVAVRPGDGDAVVTVEDDGPGMAESDLDALFEPFARGDRSRSRETGGAGLGLTVARQVARAHGGDLVLTIRPEGGLRATLTLPLASD